MKKIDCWICNPPYNIGSSYLCSKIDKIIKTYNPKRFISIQPIYSDIKYKNAEQIITNFDGNYNSSKNIFIMDMLGSKNEYMSDKKPYWVDKNSKNFLYARWNKNFTIISKETSNYSNAAYRMPISEEFFPMDFLNWLQTNDYANWVRTTFFFFLPKIPCINKLWEIYNAED